MLQYNFSVELSPPTNPNDIPAYCHKFLKLLHVTHKVCLASHPVGPIPGFDRSYNLARYLRSNWPQLQILFHVTCKDLNRVNIRARLTLLKSIHIKRILVITGENYMVPECSEGLHYKSSEQLVRQIKDEFDWFEVVAIAGFPGGKPGYSDNNEQEVTRLKERVSLGVGTVYTQCIFSADQYSHFATALLEEMGSLDVIPSIALFVDHSSLQKCLRLTRVKTDVHLVQQIEQLSPAEGYSFAKNFLMNLCKTIRSRHPETEINLCMFGQFDLALDLISEIMDNPCSQNSSRFEGLATDDDGICNGLR